MNKIEDHTMYIKADFLDFSLKFSDFNKEDNFSIQAKEALFDYLEHLEEEAGEQIKLDVIALCCDYREDEISEVLASYNLNSLEDLMDKTEVIWHNEERVLYQVY